MNKKIIFTLLFSFSFCACVSQQKVLTGLDVLEENNFREIAGKRVGLITNHSSVNKNGLNAIDVLHKAGNVNLAVIFSPEHGFRGVEDAGAYIDNSSDPVTGTPVISLYGKNKLRPTPEMLKDIDVLVFDIQDIGARFYTYLTTMGYAIEEADKLNIPFIVLDRPNPIGGKTEGPVLADDVNAFTAYFKVPTRHGFTAGEMALFHKKTKNLNLDLKVIKLKGWTRDTFFNETGVKWTNPSPNIRETDAEVLYPGIGCFEASNFSVGRGTDIPFLWFGAPWLDSEKMVAQLSQSGLKGVNFEPLALTPKTDVYAGENCKGVKINITDQKAVNALDIMVYASYFARLNHSDKFKLREVEIKKMTGSDELYNMLEAGKEPQEILKSYRQQSEKFISDTASIRLYK